MTMRAKVSRLKDRLVKRRLKLTVAESPEVVESFALQPEYEVPDTAFQDPVKLT